jgi:hypothetical protein
MAEPITTSKNAHRGETSYVKLNPITSVAKTVHDLELASKRAQTGFNNGFRIERSLRARVNLVASPALG